MKIKVYLNDWFYNAGIVGFLRILEDNDDEFAIRKNNYIEFDTEDELREYVSNQPGYLFRPKAVYRLDNTILELE